MVMGIQVRAATENDLDWCLGELQKFDVHFGSKIPLFGENSRGLLTRFIRDHIMLVADMDGCGPVGFIGGWAYPHPFNQAIRVLTLGFWWVVPEHRRSRAGLMLLDSLTEIGVRSYDWVSFAIGADAGISDSTMLRRGFKLREKNYLLEVE